MNAGVIHVSGQNFKVNIVGIRFINYNDWNYPDSAQFRMRSSCKSFYNLWEITQNTPTWIKGGTGDWHYNTQDDTGSQMNAVLKENHGTCYDWGGNDIKWYLEETTGTHNVVVGWMYFDMNGKSKGNYNVGCYDSACTGEGSSANYFEVQIQLS